MNLFRRLLLASALLSPVLAHGQSTSIVFQITGTTASTEAIASILERRFDSVKPGFFTSVSTQVTGGRVTLKFSGWSPSKLQTEYLISTAGLLKISFQGERDSPLIAESDIADARPLAGGSRNELAIRLTDAAANKVLARTRDGTGKELVVEWEHRVIAKLRISAPLSRDTALTIPADYDVLLMSAALRGGRIPNGITVALAP